MKSPDQLKGAILHMATKNHLRAQEVLQMFLFERILERLAVSPYREKFILKGGLLISSMLGIRERTTMDMDTTVRGLPMEEEQITPVVREILGIDVGDGIEFVFRGIDPIREEDAYNNFRVHLDAVYGKICAPMKIDITTGDKITPAAVEYEYRFLFEEKSVPVMAYPLETILAEKYETIIRRNIGTTRARDFYDLHTLFHMRREEIRIPVLRGAVIDTASKRGSMEDLRDWEEIVQDIRAEDALQRLWGNYVEENRFASELTFSEVVDSVEAMGRLLGNL